MKRPLPGHRSPCAARLAMLALTVALTGPGLALNGHAAPAGEGGQDTPWKEAAIALPGAPAAGDLLRFDVSARTSLNFAIDARSLTTGKDGVVRYTVVTTSQSGARNVSYEGIRCRSMEKKLYAFGRPDGTWSHSRKDQWEPISSRAANPYHAALAVDYFCQNGSVAGNATAIAERLRSGHRLSP